WLEPWDGKTSCPLERLHPLGIEICRRVRLQCEGGTIQAKAGNSECARMNAGESRGAVADPWMPLEIAEADEVKALTATPDALGYRKLAELLFDSSRFRLPLLSRPSREERGAVATLIAQVLVRGQGKTEGFHRRELSLPPPVVKRLADRDGELAQRSRQFLQLAGTIHGKVLRPALIQFVDGSAEPNWKNPQYGTLVKPALRRAERLADAVFFFALFDSLEQEISDAEAERSWGERLAEQSSQIFTKAIAELPTRAQTRIIAAARARSLLETGLRKHVASLRQMAPDSEDRT
ncbi:CRISPR-associated protein, Cse1 family, partial [mine drainage metagenome]